MVEIEKIKALRVKTGLGIHEIKRALEEAEGDEKRARELLKQRGLDVVAKRTDRSTGAGLIDCYLHGQGRIGAMVELSCETDFVARNEDFRALVHEIALQVASMNPASLEDLLSQEYFRDPALTIRDLLNATIAKIGENIKIRRFSRFELGT